MDDVLDVARDWQQAGRGVALATVLRTWGSSPCPAGSQLVADAAGRFEGSVSGGCVEAAVIEAAGASIGNGRLRRLEFGVSDARAWEVGLACGGTVQILVQPVGGAQGIAPALLARMAAARAGTEPALAVVTNLGDGAQKAFPAGAGADGEVGAALDLAQRRDGAQVAATADGEVLVQVFQRRPRLVIVGAVHIAQHLAALARACGQEVVVVDPRAAFATAQRFPGVALRVAWPDTALAALQPDARTAVVVLSHDPKLDDPALVAALRAGTFYIGALGSRRNHANRLERLAAHGFTAAQLARVHGPVGLDIGAGSPAEIAVSILAEVIQALRRRHGDAGPG